MAILKYLALLLSALALGMNTLMFTKPDVVLQSPFDNTSIDVKAVSERLSKGIQFAAIRYMDESLVEPEVFIRFHTFLKQSYPKLNEVLSVEVVNELSFNIAGKAQIHH
ncbi:hypothetical protein ACU6U9_13675 [Pseudomonas sp. HK3]|jgi:carboxypeptidase PM20D1